LICDGERFGATGNYVTVSLDESSVFGLPSEGVDVSGLIEDLIGGERVDGK
jgi:hypothetical protein